MEYVYLLKKSYESPPELKRPIDNFIVCGFLDEKKALEELENKRASNIQSDKVIIKYWVTKVELKDA